VLKRHWTPRYLFDRTREKLYRFTHPDLPWLTPQANSFLSQYLTPEMVGLEFGSGRSTIFFAQKVHFLSSVEHNPIWYEKVTVWLEKNHITNVDYRLFPRTNERNPLDEQYVQFSANFQLESLDFVLIDGIFREYCTCLIMKKIKPGGILIIDNVNRYLPGETLSPNSVGKDRPASSILWSELHQTLSSWKQMWSSNGVSDTAIYFKP